MDPLIYTNSAMTGHWFMPSRAPS
jgi:hypothetical protein